MFLRSFLSFSHSIVNPVKQAASISPISLYTVPQCSIVYRYIKKRSPFDKTNYIEDYVPPPVKYHRTRKPRLAQWDDPNVHWPPYMPKPTKLQGKQLLRSIEDRERHKLLALRPFTVPDVRSGDLIELKYLFSRSESMGNILNAVVIGRKRKNSYNSSFRVVMRVAGEQVTMDFKELSPLLAGIRIINRGAGNLRAKLYHMSREPMSKSKLSKAVLKSIIKRRKDDKVKRKVKKQPKVVIEDKTI